MPFVDLHLHVLPGMDDGSKSPEESVEILSALIRQGCGGCAATSHYYPKESIPAFLARREKAWERLKPLVAEKLPGFEKQILLGAEVAYHTGLAQDEELHKLCIGNSNYLLLEMPFSQWGPSVLRDVAAISSVHGLVPVIAHFERFLKYTDKKSREELLNLNVVIQMNAGSLLHFSTRRKALSMIKDGTVQVLATDSHNMEERRPRFDEAAEVLCRAHLEEELERCCNKSIKIFRSGQSS